MKHKGDMMEMTKLERLQNKYEGYQIESVDVRRGINSVASKRTRKEVIVTNY